MLCIESVPNDLEQVRNAAHTLCDKVCRKEPLAPWFWSDQYDLGLRMMGLSQGHDRIVVGGTPVQPEHLADEADALKSLREVPFNIARGCTRPEALNSCADECTPLTGPFAAWAGR